jgi:coproporphyrinogen III oxidase
MNIRYFEAGTNWWFGGGIDLTPYYPNVDQVIGFHRALKDVCDRHGQPYQEYKEECDRYFFLKHRGETRGVGGVFFEYLRNDKRKMFEFVKDVGMTLTKAYAPIALANKDLPFTPEMREFQLLRRSRYVEFNLLFDRGTKFGIESDGRTESILMSLPTVAKWKYSYHPAEGTIEHKFISNYLKPQEWLTMTEEEKQKIRLHIICHVKGQNTLLKKLKNSQSECVALIAGAALGVAGTLAFLKYSKQN